MADPNVKSGAMLGFKVGSQSTVDTMLSQGANAGAIHGCFYLTNDSHRLYIGNEDGSLSAVNEGIQSVTWTQLETIAASIANDDAKKEAMRGRFFYATDAAHNVLCVYNGKQWVQLNENTDTKVSNNAFGVSQSGNTVTVTDTITLVNNDGTANSEKYADFTVTGANGITVSGSGTAITFTGDTYTLSSAAVSGQENQIDIKLDSTNTNNDSSVRLVGGTNVTLARDNSTGNITISSQDTKTSFQSVTGSNVASPGTGFDVTVKIDNVEKTGTIDPAITVKNADKTATAATKFSGGVAALDVYSTAAIDEKMKALNAMTYRGTVGNSGSAATSITKSGDTITILNGSTAVPVSVGDTFLTVSDDVYESGLKAGSLLIVRALEGKSEDPDTGIIAPGDFTFDVVEESGDTDTTYKLTNANYGVTLHSNTNQDVGSFVVTAGDNNDYINIAEAGAVGGNAKVDKVLTVTHKDVTRTNTTGTTVAQGAMGTVSIPVITAITSDAKGHITGVETTLHTLTDTNGDLKEMTSSTSAANNIGTVTVGTTFKKSNNNETPVSTSFNVSSETFTVASTAASGSTPAGLAINMVWGSF